MYIKVYARHCHYSAAYPYVLNILRALLLFCASPYPCACVPHAFSSVKTYNFLNFNLQSLASKPLCVYAYFLPTAQQWEHFGASTLVALSFITFFAMPAHLS